MDIIKKYWDSIYQYILLLIPFLCICAGVFWTICKILGQYPDISWIKIVLFDFSQLIYLVIAIYLIFQNKKEPTYIINHLIYIKLYIGIALLIQYNFILHLFPSDHVWECTFLFFAVIVFFFDSKMMAMNIISYVCSLVIATLLKPKIFLPLDKANYKEIIAFRIVILLLTSFSIMIIVFFVERFLFQAQTSQKENIELLEKQLEHYQNIDLLDMELRKFRHDIRNHFLCMEHLFQNGRIEEFNVYFQDLKQSFAFQEKFYFSGNHIIDAILNNDLSRHCSGNVMVTVYGSLPEIHSISSMDLCTLFSNILSNAITSVNKCDSSMNPELTIHFQNGSRYFFIGVSNSICENDVIKVNPQKKKPSNRNHGFGLNKIKEIVEKYNGTFEQKSDNQMITTEVYLPL